MFLVGQKGSLNITFHEREVRLFSELSLDNNPIHFDEEYASKTRFKQRIVQGPMVASLIGGVLGSNLPGPGTIYINQNINFLKPVYIGDTVTAYVEITAIKEDKNIIKLNTWVEKDNGEIVINGDATVLFLKNI